MASDERGVTRIRATTTTTRKQPRVGGKKRITTLRVCVKASRIKVDATGCGCWVPFFAAAGSPPTFHPEYIKEEGRKYYYYYYYIQFGAAHQLKTFQFFSPLQRRRQARNIYYTMADVCLAKGRKGFFFRP